MYFILLNIVKNTFNIGRPSVHSICKLLGNWNITRASLTLNTELLITMQHSCSYVTICFHEIFHYYSFDEYKTPNITKNFIKNTTKNAPIENFFRKVYLSWQKMHSSCSVGSIFAWANNGHTFVQ